MTHKAKAAKRGPVKAPTVEDVVAGAMRRHLPRLGITHVHVEKSEDHDGDPVWRVTAVFSKAPTEADGPALAAISRHLCQALEDADMYEFPILSFVSKRDAAKLKLATA
jgi:hypothetical protein